MNDYFSQIKNPYGLVKRVLYKYRYSSDYDDLVQDCIIKVWMECDRNYNPSRGSLVSFAVAKILAQVYNRRLSMSRSEKARGGKELVPFGFDSDLDIDDTSQTLIDIIAAQIIYSQFLDTIDNYKHRNIIDMVFHGYTFEEAGRENGFSKTRARVIYHTYIDKAKVSLNG
jgi:RNA polymerase sigma factor (sigma-70 family)